MSQNDGLVMVLDAGGGGGRCLIFSAGGKLEASAHRAWCFSAPDDVPFGSEFNPAAFWRVLGEVTGEALRKGGISPKAIRGISATSFRDGVVFLDEKDCEIYGGSNMDCRGLIYAGEVAERAGERIRDITGRVPLGLDAAARLLWFRDNRPEEYRRLRRLQMVSDWIVLRLTGEYTADPSNACSSLLFDINQRKWSFESAAALELNLDFPSCLNSGETAGILRPEAAAHLGLPPGIPVSAGVADSQAGTLGCGCLDHGQTAAIVGTTVPVQMVLAEPSGDPSGRTWLGNHALPGRWVLESNGGMAGSILQWYRDHFAPDPGTADPYRAIETAAAAEPPGAAFTLLGPRIADMSRLQIPLYGAIFIPTAGPLPSLTRPRLARAIMENVAYAVRGNLEQLQEVASQKVERLIACGGMTRSPLMVRILAAVAGVPLAVPVNREATSLGAAMAAATACGIYHSLEEAAAEMVHLEKPAIDPALQQEYRGLYQQWLELNEKLSG